MAEEKRGGLTHRWLLPELGAITVLLLALVVATGSVFARPVDFASANPHIIIDTTISTPTLTITPGGPTLTPTSTPAETHPATCTLTSTPTPTDTPTITLTPTGTPPTFTRTRTPTRTGTVTTSRTPTRTPTQGACVQPIVEDFESGTLGLFSSSGSPGWSATTTDSHSGLYSAFAPDVAFVSDQVLTTNSSIAVPLNATQATLTFWQRYDFEIYASTAWDGGVLEVSSNGGGSWSTPTFVSGGYTGVLVNCPTVNPLAGRAAWVGSNGGWAQATVNLLAYRGQSVLLRFRLGTDGQVDAPGWWVDDFIVSFAQSVCFSPTPTNTPINNSPTSTPTSMQPTNTPTPLPTSYPNLWPGMVWATPCVQPSLRLTTYSNSAPFRAIGPSVMRLTNSAGDYRDFSVPGFINFYESYSYDCVVSSCIPNSWLVSLPFTLTVDYGNNIIEFNEIDNVMQQNDLPPDCPVLVGHVTWQGPPDQPNTAQQLPITLTLKSGTTEVNYASLTTDASGFFTVPVGSLANGTYDWRVKGPKYLANAGTVVLSGAPSTSVEMGLMRAGDANNDNVVQIVDFNILKSTIGKSFGDPGYDARADFNNDDAVSIGDFNLLRGNFGQIGASPP